MGHTGIALYCGISTRQSWLVGRRSQCRVRMRRAKRSKEIVKGDGEAVGIRQWVYGHRKSAVYRRLLLPALLHLVLDGGQGLFQLHDVVVESTFLRCFDKILSAGTHPLPPTPSQYLQGEEEQNGEVLG